MSKRVYQGISALLIASGLLVMLYPFGSRAYFDYKRRELLRQWNVQRSSLQENAPMQIPVKGNGPPAQALETAPAVLPIEREESLLTTLVDPFQDLQDYPMVGVLEIPAISLTEPILKGATDRHLKCSLATVEPAGVPGEAGNFVVAGHKSRVDGKHFNRLQQVQVQDKILVHLPERSVCYTVERIQIIEATDTWILDSDGSASTITLLTCYYSADGVTRRLAVQGVADAGDDGLQ